MLLEARSAELRRQANFRKHFTYQIPQMLFLSAATGKAFTTVFAGLALTITSLPKIIFFPAFVAGFWRVLIWQTPGITNLPALFTSFVAMTARLLITWEHTVFFNPYSSASAAATSPLVMTLAPAFFIAFIGAMVSPC